MHCLNVVPKRPPGEEKLSLQNISFWALGMLLSDKRRRFGNC